MQEGFDHCSQILETVKIIIQTVSMSFSDLCLTLFLRSIRQRSPEGREMSSMLTEQERTSSRSLIQCPTLCSAPLLSQHNIELKLSSIGRSYTLVLYEGGQWVCVLRELSYISLDVSKTNSPNPDSMKMHRKQQFQIWWVKCWTAAPPT